MSKIYENENLTMRFFTTIGIILVVAGHLGFDALSLGGLFPYYSFHIYIFLFVAGFFYNPDDENRVWAYILKKIKRFLVPYLIFNLLYGVLSTVLNLRGVYVGHGISLYNLLVAPFLGGHQFMFNAPAWFVVALFVVEIIYILSRIGFNIITSNKHVIELGMLVLFLGLGIATIYLAINGHAWGFYKNIGRWLLMLPGISFGRCFRVYVQPFVRTTLAKIYDKAGLERRSMINVLSYVIYFAVIIAIQYMIVINTAGLNISVLWCTSFSNGPVIPFITALTGMAFWYGIASLLAKCTKLSFLANIGRHSYSIMMHHFFVLFLINTVCGLIVNFSGSFDLALYNTDITYQYLYVGEGITQLVNTIICIVLPVLGAMLWLKSPICDKIKL